LKDIGDLFYEDEQANVHASQQHEARGKSPSYHRTDSSASIEPPAHSSADLSQTRYPYYPVASLDAHFSPTDPMLYSEPRQQADSSTHAYLNFFTASPKTSGGPCPGLFFTDFDEQNPLYQFLEAENYDMDQT
jgi:hypothetical protein